MPPPFDVDEANPADDAVVSQYPANERASRQNIVNMFEVEHHEGTGRHQIPAGNTAARDAITDWQQGSIFWNTQTSPRKIQRQTAAASPFSWEDLEGSSLPAGTRMVFDQDAAPTGWTRDVSINDRVIRIVSGARAHGGSWTISGLTVDSHVLTVAEIPAHTHTSQPGRSNLGGDPAGGDTKPTYNASDVTGSAGGGGGHTHGLTADGTWRPLHRDMIIAAKD